MTSPVDISRLLALRSRLSDQMLLDYLEILELLSNSVSGQAPVEQIKQRWNCSLIYTRIRLSRLVDEGLAYFTQDGRVNLCDLPPR